MVGGGSLPALELNRNLRVSGNPSPAWILIDVLVEKTMIWDMCVGLGFGRGGRYDAMTGRDGRLGVIFWDLWGRTSFVGSWVG